MNANTTYVSGITCKACQTKLPKMLMVEHLNKNNMKNICKVLCKR